MDSSDPLIGAMRPPVDPEPVRGRRLECALEILRAPSSSKHDPESEVCYRIAEWLESIVAALREEPGGRR